jgi:hypothetical protein
MIYISYGVPKSASTFTYIVTQTVLQVAGYPTVQLPEHVKGVKSRLNYIAAMSWVAIERVKATIGDKSVVVKTHGAPDKRVLEAVARGELYASAVIRDPREIALSLLDHAGRSRSLGIPDFAEFESLTDTFKALDDQFGRRLGLWMQSDNVLLLTYDQIAFDTEAAVGRIIKQLGLSVDVSAVMAALPKRAEVEQFNKGAKKRYETEMPAETQAMFLERYADVYRLYLKHERSTGSAPAPRASATAAAQLSESTCADLPEEELRKLVRALYHVLLFREPDPGGLRAYVQRLQAGASIETVNRQILESQEFAQKRNRFLRTYIRGEPREAPSTGAKTVKAEPSSEPLNGSGNSATQADAEHLIYVHSHRRSGTHFLLDTIRAWFDVPEEIHAIPNPAHFPRVVAPTYAPYSLSKDHEPAPGFKLKQIPLWHSADQRERGRHLYEAGSHIYIVRNPLQVLRSAYIFDLSGAEPRHKVDTGTSFLDYLAARSTHTGNRGLTRLEYWLMHVKSWYFDEQTLVVHYDDLKNDTASVVAAISKHVGLPARQSAREVAPTGIKTDLTKAFLAKGESVVWDTAVIDAIKAAAERIIGPRPWRGLEHHLDAWLVS